MSELWAKWEGEVINGGLPLRRLVGVSDHSGVFLTEAPARNLPNAAIKLVPAIPTLAESQLAYWNAAANLSHPRLLRLYDAGRCQLGNLHFLYVLMEYADQNLAQLLETRALTEVEARETLPPLLEGLGFLHSRNLVQGQLKPSNILVVGEQLKLASDTIRPAGEAATSISMVSVYDPPEGRDGSFSTAGDIWALGVTLYQALTRTTPVRPDERSHGVVLPSDFPLASADVIRECLSRRPIDRPSVAALEAWVSGKVRYPGAAAAAAAAAAVTTDAGYAGTAGVAESERAAPTRAGGSGTDAGARAAASSGVARRDRRAVALEGAGAAMDDREAVGQGGVERTTSERAARTSALTAAADGSAGGGVPGSDSRVAGSGGGVPASGSPGRLTIRVEREPIPEEPPEHRSILPVAAAAAAVLAVLIIAWGGVRLLGHRSSDNSPSTSVPSSNTTQPTPQSGDSQAQAAQSSQTQPSAAAAPSPPPTPSMSGRTASHRSGAASNNPTSPGASDSSDVVHEEIPNVPHSALATIHGHVKVAVRVTVDSSGNVVDDSLDHAGPSQYFARVASKAARKWKFAPTDQKSSRQWLVHFDFSRTGTMAHATSRRS